MAVVPVYSCLRAVIISSTMSVVTLAGMVPDLTRVSPLEKAFSFQLLSALPCTGT